MSMSMLRVRDRDRVCVRACVRFALRLRLRLGLGLRGRLRGGELNVSDPGIELGDGVCDKRLTGSHGQFRRSMLMSKGTTTRR